MSGWTMFTIEPISYEDYDGVGHPDEEIQNRLLEYGLDTDQYIWTANRLGYIVARVTGYRDWEADLELLIESGALDLLERVVIIQANDTTDTGAAKLYNRRSKSYDMGTPDIEGENYDFVLKDTYAETQKEDGCQVGKKAASVMHVLHDVPALSNVNGYRGYSVESTADRKENTTA